MKDTLNTEKKFNTRFLLSNQSGVSMVTLIVTIIVVVILAGIAIFVGGEGSIDKATKVKFIQELSEVQTATDLLKKEKYKLKNKDYGFKRIAILNPPSGFVSMSNESMVACVIDLEYIDMPDTMYGHEYKNLDYENDSATFKVTDVYVYDATGTVYYVKGVIVGDETIHRIGEASSFESPIIESITYVLHASKQKAMISIEAYSNSGARVTVTVDGEEAGYQDDDRFYIEKTENKTYEVVATDQYGNKTVSSIEVEGILSPEDAETDPTTEPEIISFSATAQYGKFKDLNASAIDSDDGIVAYVFSMGSGLPATGWQEISKTKTRINVSMTIDKGGVYYFWVKNSENVCTSAVINVEFENIIYNIKYQLNGGTWASGESKDQEKKNDDVITIHEEVPMRPGYSFVGWTSSNAGGEVQYNPGDEYSAENDLTLYAIWKAKTNTPYKVERYTENINGQYVLEETENLTGKTDSVVEAPSKSYNYFVIAANHPNAMRSGIVKGDGSLVLKVYYSRKAYNVNVSGENGRQTASGSFKYGTQVTVRNTPNDGYEFKNWEIMSGSISDFKPNVAVCTFTMPGSDIVLSAKNEIVVYTLTYNLNGGSVTGENPKTYTVKDTFTLNNPQKDGYRFKGWSGTGISGTSLNITIASQTGNRTYSAVFEELFNLTSMNDYPTYNPVKIKVTSVDNVQYEYSLDKGTTWQSCNGVTVEGDKYVTYVTVNTNTTVKVRALKEDGTVEDEKEIKVSNILFKTKANAPKLGDGMVAVYWEGNTQKTATAFTTDMYDYIATSEDNLQNNLSRWANAQTEDGSYWVWIPRFAYKIQYYKDANRTIATDDKTEYEKIFIMFLNETSNTVCVNSTTGGIETVPEDYTILPMFNYKEIELEGIWVAKYDMSSENARGSLGGGNILTTNAGNMDEVTVVSKPDLSSWRGISYNVADKNSKAMFIKYNSELIANKEWEAVAILAQSIYGINTIQITNGNNITGTGTSTTGNKTGIYDLSANAWEYVQNDEITSGITLIKYLDKTILNSSYASSIIKQKVRGTNENNNIVNFPENGGADSRIGYRVALHIY